MYFLSWLFHMAHRKEIVVNSLLAAPSFSEFQLLPNSPCKLDKVGVPAEANLKAVKCRTTACGFAFSSVCEISRISECHQFHIFFK